MKPSRNDPCPCGSTKKYKHCCLKTEQAQPEDDFLWRRIRRAIEGSPVQLLNFGSSHFGQEAMLEAWDEFIPQGDDGQNEPFTPVTPHMPIFMPWFFYDWTPAPLETSVKPEALDGRTLAVRIWTKKPNNLTRCSCVTWNNAVWPPSAFMM
jgi:SEC-C motif